MKYDDIYEKDRGKVVDLLTLLIADFASVAENSKLNVMGIFGEIQAKKFPAVHPLMVIVTRLSASAAEAGNLRKLNIKLMDDDGKITLVDYNREIKIELPKAGRRREYNGILRVNNVVFPHAGTYQVSVLVDGDEKGNTSLDVVQVT